MNNKELFENWYQSVSDEKIDFTINESGRKRYAVQDVDYAWSVWQACAEQYEARLKVAEDALEGLSYQSEDILNTSQSVMISANYVKKISDEALNKIRGEK